MSHVVTAIYVLDFLKVGKARGEEKDEVERMILALERLRKQVGCPRPLLHRGGGGGCKLASL